MNVLFKTHSFFSPHFHLCIMTVINTYIWKPPVQFKSSILYPDKEKLFKLDLLPLHQSSPLKQIVVYLTAAFASSPLTTEEDSLRQGGFSESPWPKCHTLLIPDLSDSSNPGQRSSALPTIPTAYNAVRVSLSERSNVTLRWNWFPPSLVMEH